MWVQLCCWHRYLTYSAHFPSILQTTQYVTVFTIASVLSGSELMSGISPLNRAANSSSESLLKLGELKSLWLDEVECGDSGRSADAAVSSTDVPGSCRTDGGWYTECTSSPLERTEGCGANISALWSGWDVPLGKPVISHRNDQKPLFCLELFPHSTKQTIPDRTHDDHLPTACASCPTDLMSLMSYSRNASF
jgi:hypothetical protein